MKFKKIVSLVLAALLSGIILSSCLEDQASDLEKGLSPKEEDVADTEVDDSIYAAYEKAIKEYIDSNETAMFTLEDIDSNGVYELYLPNKDYTNVKTYIYSEDDCVCHDLRDEAGYRCYHLLKNSPCL